jgi:hypothetical protein
MYKSLLSRMIIRKVDVLNFCEFNATSNITLTPNLNGRTEVERILKTLVNYWSRTMGKCNAVNTYSHE